MWWRQWRARGSYCALVVSFVTIYVVQAERGRVIADDSLPNLPLHRVNNRNHNHNRALLFRKDFSEKRKATKKKGRKDKEEKKRRRKRKKKNCRPKHLSTTFPPFLAYDSYFSSFISSHFFLHAAAVIFVALPSWTILLEISSHPCFRSSALPLLDIESVAAC